MGKYEIERRSLSEAHLSSDAYKPTEKELDKWYNQEKQTLSEIAEKCNVTSATIRVWME